MRHFTLSAGLGFLFLDKLAVGYSIADHGLLPSISIPEEPIGSSSRLVKRVTTSSDPSCPEGYLCVLDDCPIDLRCSEGNHCVNFEGTLRCLPDSGTWCALDLANGVMFGGVGQGICW
jgi:hypothetical protein